MNLDCKCVLRSFVVLAPICLSLLLIILVFIAFVRNIVASYDQMIKCLLVQHLYLCSIHFTGYIIYKIIYRTYVSIRPRLSTIESCAIFFQVKSCLKNSRTT